MKKSLIMMKINISIGSSNCHNTNGTLFQSKQQSVFQIFWLYHFSHFSRFYIPAVVDFKNQDTLPLGQTATLKKCACKSVKVVAGAFVLTRNAEFISTSQGCKIQGKRSTQDVPATSICRSDLCSLQHLSGTSIQK